MNTEQSENKWHGPQPAPRALARFVRANFPTVQNLGIYVQRNVAGTNVPSAHAEGRAVDLGFNAFDKNEKYLGDQIFAGLVSCAREMSIDHVIWNRQIWSSKHPHIHGYTGVSPHTDHIHIAFTRAGSQRIAFPRFEMILAAIRTGIEDLHPSRARTG